MFVVPDSEEIVTNELTRSHTKFSKSPKVIHSQHKDRERTKERENYYYYLGTIIYE